MGLECNKVDVSKKEENILIVRIPFIWVLYQLLQGVTGYQSLSISKYLLTTCCAGTIARLTHNCNIQRKELCDPSQAALELSHCNSLELCITALFHYQYLVRDRTKGNIVLKYSNFFYNYSNTYSCQFLTSQQQMLVTSKESVLNTHSDLYDTNNLVIRAADHPQLKSCFWGSLYPQNPYSLLLPLSTVENFLQTTTSTLFTMTHSLSIWRWQVVSYNQDHLF